MHARQPTPEEHAQGYALCGCEKYVYVWKSEGLHWMPPDYHGELCHECGAGIYSVEKLRMAEAAMRHGEPSPRRYGDG